jgi:GT2 family glycosyltransferase
VAEPADVFGFSGGAALLRRSAAVAVGGFPVRFFLYYEDTDLSWRLRLAGWSIRYEPTAVVHHRHAASSDVSSGLFAFHNERNRLLTLVRCAPAGAAAGAWLRFVLTTGSLAVRQLRTGRRQQARNLQVWLRIRVLLSAIGLLPWAVRARARIRPGRGEKVDPQLGG